MQIFYGVWYTKQVIAVNATWSYRWQMIDLKDLECLTALARHRHFARAAEECGLSQPAFSMRIRNLEDRLRTQIVRRGNRFQGLTPQGEIVLSRARGILDQTRSLEEEVRAARGEVVGILKLGTVPTATAYAAQVAGLLRTRHPGVRMRIDTTNSLRLQQGMEDARYDAALSYSDGIASGLLRAEPLYQERYVLLVPAPFATGHSEITWTEAAALPLILLEPEMQNRRILDEIFEEVGAQPTVVAETDGFTAAIAMSAEGLGATVLPEVLVGKLGAFEGAELLPLTAPIIERSVCLLTPRRAQAIPVVDALRSVLGISQSS